MARSSARRAHPGRTVTVFFIGLAVAYGLVALIGTWKPALGLDLEGGTQITLIAQGNVKSDELQQAANIINDRVNGSGVAEADVTTQGSDEIVVQVPGSTKNSLLQTVIRQARLRFRLVAIVPQSGTPQTSPSTGPTTSPSPGVGVQEPHPGAAGHQEARHQEAGQQEG
jgi:preprotein translocase subunit SecD